MYLYHTISQDGLGSREGELLRCFRRLEHWTAHLKRDMNVSWMTLTHRVYINKFLRLYSVYINA